MMVLPDTSVTFGATSELLLFCCQEQAGADRERFLEAIRPPLAPYPVDESNIVGPLTSHATSHATSHVASHVTGGAPRDATPRVAFEATAEGETAESADAKAIAAQATLEAYRQQNDELQRQLSFLRKELNTADGSRRCRRG